MIELPRSPAPNNVAVGLIDFGMHLRPSTGARVNRFDRKGNRFRTVISFPPMEPSASRIFVSRCLTAKREGLRILFPLMDGPQGSPGAPMVNGAGQAGTKLAIRGATPHYAVKEGYWLSIEDESGQHYLHNCRANAIASSAGTASIEIEPELRIPFADGAKVHLARPMVEGFVVGDAWEWQVPVDGLISLNIPLEECE